MRKKETLKMNSSVLKDDITKIVEFVRLKSGWYNYNFEENDVSIDGSCIIIYIDRPERNLCFYMCEQEVSGSEFGSMKFDNDVLITLDRIASEIKRKREQVEDIRKKWGKVL